MICKTESAIEYAIRTGNYKEEDGKIIIDIGKELGYQDFEPIEVKEWRGLDGN